MSQTYSETWWSLICWIFSAGKAEISRPGTPAPTGAGRRGTRNVTGLRYHGCVSGVAQRSGTRTRLTHRSTGRRFTCHGVVHHAGTIHAPRSILMRCPVSTAPARRASPGSMTPVGADRSSPGESVLDILSHQRSAGTDDRCLYVLRNPLVDRGADLTSGGTALDSQPGPRARRTCRRAGR